MKHADLLSPWQRLTARWLGWHYARIWVQAKHGKGQYFLTVRVSADGTVPLQWVRYEETPADPERGWPGMLTSTSSPAPLSHFTSLLLTEGGAQ